eukprot:g1278.t1
MNSVRHKLMKYYRRHEDKAKLAKLFFSCLSVFLPVAITIADNVGRPARVTGPSMTPTLNVKNSWFNDIVWCHMWRTTPFQRGDIVLLDHPFGKSSSGKSTVVVKRLVALENDFVTPRRGPTAGRTIRLKEGHCWVEGDNAMESVDSREYGSIPLALVKGRVTRVLWPPSRFRILSAETIPETAKSAHVRTPNFSKVIRKDN